MRIAIIGAGPAGITAAYELSKAGISVDVYEASDSVGGLARTITLWGQKVDLGPHRFFSDDARVNRIWLEVMKRDYAMVSRLTRIYYRSQFFQYPIKPVDALSKLGYQEAVLCLASYAAEKFNTGKTPTTGETFESWVSHRFGQRLYETFFKHYSEKLWGISCDQLDADFAAQRIKKLSLLEVVRNALSLGGQNHKTLLDEFAYPLGGSGVVYERMAEFVKSKGNRVWLKSPIKRVVTEKNRAVGIELEGQPTLKYDHIISTMPLTLLVKNLPEVPEEVVSASESLSFRNTILVYLNIESTNLFPDQWLYVQSPELKMGRITNFRNWVPQLNGDSKSTILALEYWCFDEDAIWTEKDETIIAQAETELRSTGLIEDARCINGHVFRIKRCYPVYRVGYKSHLEKIVAYMKTIQNLSAIGRYGSFKYNNQDHSILMGLLAAENVIANKKNDLWSINTDYESYYESAKISETGLEEPTPAKKEAA